MRDALHTWCIAIRERRMKCNHRITHINFIVSIISVSDDVWSVNLLQVTYTVLNHKTAVSTVLMDGAWEGRNEGKVTLKTELNQIISTIAKFTRPKAGYQSL